MTPLRLLKLTSVLLLLFVFIFVGASPIMASTIDDKKKTLLKLINQYHHIEKQFDIAFEKTIKDIEKSYYLQLNKASRYVPPAPAPKDMFETQYEYNTRIEKYNAQLTKAKLRQRIETRKIHKQFNLRYKISMAEVEHFEKKIQQLKPIDNEIRELQKTTFPISVKTIKITLYPPEAENFRFPIHLTSAEQKWVKYWEYNDRKRARILWKNKSFIAAEMRSQFEVTNSNSIVDIVTVIRVFNTKTGDYRIYKIGEVKKIPEIAHYENMVQKDLPAAKLMAALKNVVKGPIDGMEFVYISPRTFLMGSPRYERGRWANEIQHKVTLTKGYYIQTAEVTQRQWRIVMRNNPSRFKSCGSDCPVENVYWGDVQEFIRKLNKMEKNSKYRLPTEAEWEFACRAGNLHFGANDDNEKRLMLYGWYFDNSEGKTHPVALKKPNRWGLFDMQGNVSEWSNDWAGTYSPKDITDPQGPYKGRFRIARGGNWQMSDRSCRCADRNFNLPGDKSETIGFRLVKSPLK